jgi:hypothetical protein
MAEKMLRPVPEYTRLSVRSIADSSSVGSRLDEVLAIFFAATPGATPRPVFDAGADEEDEPVVFAGAAVVVGTTGTGAGALEPPKSAFAA